MRNLTLLFLLFSFCAQSSEQSVLTDLSSLKWQNRVIVVNEVADSEAAVSVFEDNAADSDERDLIWVVFHDSGTLTNYSGLLAPELKANTLETYRLKPGQVILIGKDGGVKSRLDQLDLDVLFSDIDSMPMRRNEMRESIR